MALPALKADALYEAYAHDARGLALRIVRNAAEADEITQATFEALPGVAARYEGTGSVRSFVLGVAANLARRTRRAVARRTEVHEALAHEPAIGSSDPEAQLAVREQAQHALRALETLPEEQRTAFMLASVGDWSAAEIAAETGVPEATVRTRIFHARRKLREVLEHKPARGLVSVTTVLVLGLLLVTATAIAYPLLRRVFSRSRAHATQLYAPARDVFRNGPAVLNESRAGAQVSDALETTGAGKPIIPIAPPSRGQTAKQESARPAPTKTGTAHAYTQHEKESLYATAHALHFHGESSAEALAAWDRYLRAEPNGPLAIEARYNRAIVLVRLNRLSDAANALAPFARGVAHGYRQSEAATLRDAVLARIAPVTPATPDATH